MIYLFRLFSLLITGTVFGSCTLREQLLEAALASPKHVGALDKGKWLLLFDSNGVIEDPIGGTKSVDDSERQSFWDGFIDQKHIQLSPIASDIVDEENYVVVRTLIIFTTLSNGVVIRVPVHVRYTFTTELKVKHLEAFWDALDVAPVSTSVRDMLGYSVGSLSAVTQLYTTWGSSWVVFYFYKILIANSRYGGIQRVQSITTTNENFANSFTDTARVLFPVQGKDLSAIEIAASPIGFLNITAADIRASGRHVSFTMKHNDISIGVGIVEFRSPSDINIKKLTLYTEDESFYRDLTKSIPSLKEYSE